MACQCCTNGYCECVCHEPILEPRGNDGLTDTERANYATAYDNGIGSRELRTPIGYDGQGSSLWPWQTEER